MTHIYGFEAVGMGFSCVILNHMHSLLNSREFLYICVFTLFLLTGFLITRVYETKKAIKSYFQLTATIGIILGVLYFLVSQIPLDVPTPHDRALLETLKIFFLTNLYLFVPGVVGFGLAKLITKIIK